MPTFKERLEGLVVDLGWSLWTELGVPGWDRRHRHVAIDPEPLILFTATIGDLDRRLRDEATDWCIAHGRWISAARLRNLLRSEPASVRARYGELAATVAAHGTVRWPLPGEPRHHVPGGRVQVPELGRPALISLRLRALFGVGARAEVIRLLLRDPDAALPAGELAPEAGYTKRNIAETLEALGLGGLLEAVPVRNQIRFRLARWGELRALLGALPEEYPAWRARFHILLRLMEVASSTEGAPPLMGAVEAAGALQELAKDLRAAGAETVPRDVVGEELWTAFETWALALAEEWGDPSHGAARAPS